MPPNKQSQTSVLQQGAGGGSWQPCLLTWYDPALGGTNSSSGAADPHSATASGEPYDPNKDTCAAPPNYPFGTMLTFQYGRNQVVCRVNDRGGAIQGSHFDLSRHAANVLGIIQAGSVNARFQVGSIAGSVGAPAPVGSGGGGGGGGGGGPDILTVLGDLATLNISDLAVQLALAGVVVIKDVALGFADWIVIPWWHWNQRAAQFYLSDELFSQDTSKWTRMPWTAAFWGLGYWLFWTDPESKGRLKPAPVRNSRIARHARHLQGLPARRSLIKPRDVAEKTPKKPPPVLSRAEVERRGTMRATRALPVRVTGTHTEPSGNRSQAPVERTGALPGSKVARDESKDNGARPEPDTIHRTRNPSLQDRAGDSRRRSAKSQEPRGRS